MGSQVGVRELRQNLSKYLTRVKEGESLVVTERGDEVARLIPLGPGANAYADLARRFDASVPVKELDEVVASFTHDPSPAGTADVIIAEGRRERG